jgi:hypothetical protein
MSPSLFSRSRLRRTAAILTGVFVVGASTACGAAGLFMRSKLQPPPQSEFGLGPRSSADHRYIATLIPDDTLRPRRLQAVRLSIVDADGRPVDGLTIAVDGGMPQHGHGLPTRPHVSRSFGGGVYEIDGVRFNMGGWWEFRLAIDGAAGSDRVTFNLQL